VTGPPLHPYVEWLFGTDPILASTEGDPRGDAQLGDITPESIAEQQRQRAAQLADAEARPDPPRGTVDWLEHQVLLTELRTATRRHELERVAERAPYWYTERLGEALSVLMTDPADDADDARAEALAARLRAMPAYLAQAQRNLTTDTPRLWAEMGAAGARGLERFVAHSVAEYVRALPAALATDVSRASIDAALALAGFASFAEELVERAGGEWACGAAQFDYLLHTYHHLELDSAELAEHGRERVDRERTVLEALAASRDPDADWRQQIDEIKDQHPEPDRFLDTYGDAMERARQHTLRAELVTVPDGAVCEMEWVPEYRREGLPLGVMSPSPPFGQGLRSGFLITPGDPHADADRRRQHMRDNCYVFATSIAGHETYPGHHVQYAHHKLGTPRDSIRRYFRTPQFVEGWGLYVEDVLEETGFLADDRLRLVKQRNALWRALRIVVDVGLHTGTMNVAEATELMQREAGMDPHMAAGEVRRYTRHDNPTYPSSYMLGRELIHRIRAARRDRQQAAAPLRDFHDWLLSFGSPPLVLLVDIEA
jgi:uncharacterized protein (DUF885 family)